MSRILTGTFVITTFLLASNTFACDRGCGCGTSRPPIRCGTVVSVECVPCRTSCPPVGCVSTGCTSGGTSFSPVEYSMAVSNGCVSCNGGKYQDKVVIADGGGNKGGSVIENVGGSLNGGGAVNGGGSENGKGSVNVGGSENGKGRLDPDVLTGSPQGLQSINSERIWTDSSGLHKRLARFVRIEGTQVILLNAQGRTTRVEVQNLSTADQLFLDQLQQTSMKRAFPSTQQHSVASRS